jgi:hypothetical protein
MIGVDLCKDIRTCYLMSVLILVVIDILPSLPQDESGGYNGGERRVVEMISIVAGQCVTLKGTVLPTV